MILWLGKIVHGFFLKAVVSDSGFRRSYSLHMNKFAELEKNLMLLLSHYVVSDSVTPWTVALQAPLSMGFSRQESWSGLPFLSPGDLLDPGIKPWSLSLAGGFFTTDHLGSPKKNERKSKHRTQRRRACFCDTVFLRPSLLSSSFSSALA